jgi:hypothetical protein
MGIFKNFRRKKENKMRSNSDFWDWFQDNEKTFFKAVKYHNNIQQNFFDKLSPKLNELRDGYWFLAGMLDDDTAELVLTADGVYKNIVFVEELVASAPKIDNWKFTALKPALDLSDTLIRMGDLEFSKENLSFYANEDPRYPDEIDITIVHADYQDDLEPSITNGVYIFVDNYLGELNAITKIDNIEVTGKEKAEKELIPIEKLKDFLIWREKEFVEKYQGIRYDTENDTYSSLEATLPNNKPLLAIVNSTLLEWDRKASHPWILVIEIEYKANEYGMPNEDVYALMNKFEDELNLELKDVEGYLNVGRQTADGLRVIYFACKDFRFPSKLLTKFSADYENRLKIDYDFYKDKYWKSLDRFRPNIL